MMICCKPMTVVDILLAEINHKNPRMREDIIIYVIFAFLTFPGNKNSKICFQRCNS